METLDNIEPTLSTYFAVQLLPKERAHAGAEAICRTANQVGTLFRRLEVLDTIDIGGRQFVRCRSDIINPHPMLEALYAANRGYVVAQMHGYLAKLPGGRTGTIPSTTMHTAGRSRVMYRGPKIKYWERAFLTE